MELIPRKDYFDDLFDLDSMMFDRTPSMKCDIYEEDDKYHIEMDVPGFTGLFIKNVPFRLPLSSNKMSPLFKMVISAWSELTLSLCNTISHEASLPTFSNLIIYVCNKLTNRSVVFY